MPFYVLYDNESNLYMGGKGGYGRQHKEPHKAKLYKMRCHCIDAASWQNTTRKDRPHVEVREFDHMWHHTNTFVADPLPPIYIPLRNKR